MSLYRVDELEEEVRELQVQGREMLDEERKRNREIVQRVEREKQLEVENVNIKLQNLEREHECLGDEAIALRSSLERTREEKLSAEESLVETQRCLDALRAESDRAKETARRETAEREEVIAALHAELESLKSELMRVKAALMPKTTPLTTQPSVNGLEDDGDELRKRLDQVESDLRVSKAEEKRLREENEELVLQSQVDQGKRLVNSSNKSLKLEMDSMTDSEVNFKKCFTMEYTFYFALFKCSFCTFLFFPHFARFFLIVSPQDREQVEAEVTKVIFYCPIAHAFGFLSKLPHATLIS